MPIPKISQVRNALAQLSAAEISAEEKAMWQAASATIDKVLRAQSASIDPSSSEMQEILNRYVTSAEAFEERAATGRSPIDNVGISAVMEVIEKSVAGITPEVELSEWIRRTYVSNQAEMAGDDKRNFTGLFLKLEEAKKTLSADAVKATIDFASRQSARVSEAFSRLEGLPPELRENIQINLDYVRQSIEGFGFSASESPVSAEAAAAEIDRLKKTCEALINVGDAVKFASNLTLPQFSQERRKTDLAEISTALASSSSVLGVELAPIDHDKISDEMTKANPFTVDAVAALAARRSGMTIKERADEDKASLMERAQAYVTAHRDAPEVDPKTLRGRVRESLGQAAKFGREGNFDAALESISSAMRALEVTREAKTGIHLVEVPVEGGVPLLIRDARRHEERPVRGTETFEIQYLNYIRGAMEIAAIEGKPELRAQLIEKAATFMESFHERKDMPAGLDERIAEERKLAKEVDRAMGEVSAFLEEQGIPNADNKVNVAKEYQNLRNPHFNIVTLSAVLDAAGAERTVMEAEVAMKGLTREQKAEYAAITDPDEARRPKWFNAMPWWEQELVREHAPAIMSGERVLSTWLLHGSGMKNAFEKVTAVAETDGRLEVVATSKHSGTLASIARDPADRDRLGRMNIDQAREWLGEGVNLDIVTFNTATIGKSHDPVITGQMSRIGNDETIGVRHTNLAFNIGRAIGAGSMLTGVNRDLDEVSTSLDRVAAENPASAAAIAVIQSHLEPRPQGMFGGLRRFFSNPFNRMRDPEARVQSLADSGAITADDAKILNTALQLRRDADEVGMGTRLLGSGNSSRAVAVGLDELLRLNREASSSALGIPKRETIGMCTSGKDRTGDYENNVSAKAIADRLGVPIGTVHSAIVPSGHTAQQAGGVYSCGASAGCNGIRIDGAWGHGNILVAVLRGAVFGKLRTGRMGDERAMVDMVEYAAHGTRDHLHKAEKGAADVTADGLDKETAHGQEVAARKAAMASARVEEVAKEAPAAAPTLSSAIERLHDATTSLSDSASVVMSSVEASQVVRKEEVAVSRAEPRAETVVSSPAVEPVAASAARDAVVSQPAQQTTASETERAAVSPPVSEAMFKAIAEARAAIPEGTVKKTRAAFAPKPARGFADEVTTGRTSGGKGGDGGRGG